VIRRIVHVVIAAAFGALATLAVPSPAPAQTTTTTTSPGGGSSGGGSSGGASPGVTLAGEGSTGPYKEITSWQNDLAGAKSPINLNYTPSGTQQGRDDLIGKTADFALSGTQFSGGSPNATAPCSTQAKSNCAPGFTPAEIGQLPNKDLTRDVIAAPVQVTALAFILGMPFNANGSTPYGFERRDQYCDSGVDPLCNDPQGTQPFDSPIDRPVRLPAANLAAMLLNVNTADPKSASTWQSNISDWDAFDVLSTFGIAPPQCDPNNFLHCFSGGFTPLTRPASVVQSEPDELNYYLQSYIRSQAPPVWASNKTLNSPPGVNWECNANQQAAGTCTAGDVLERIPRVPNLSRQGADQAGDQLTIPGGSGGGAIAGGIAGVIGALPPSALVAAPQGIQNGTPLEYVGIPNKHGEYVDPTPAAIDAAVNAGNGAPMYAMTHDVAGAYPLTWVNYLYVPSSGLSADKTEAVATLIRYLATDGQGAAAQWGEGVLSKSLSSDALRAADQVVQSNCPGAHGTIVSSKDPGADAPSTPGIHAIGDMLHCIPPAPAVSGTTAGGGGSPGFASPLLPSLATTPALATTPPAATKPSAKATPLPADLTADRLPFPLPGTPLDKIATFVVGVLGYFLLRGPISRRLGRSIE
jgi:ABC-type phosphate transport system substrate-binding protein